MDDKAVNERAGEGEVEAVSTNADNAPEAVDRREAARLMLKVAAATPIVAMLFDPRSASASGASGEEGDLDD